MAEERGDLNTYELQLNFGLSTDKAMAGLLGIDDQLAGIERQTRSLGRLFENSLVSDTTIVQFEDISDRLGDIHSETVKLAPLVKNSFVDYDDISDLIEDQFDTQEDIYDNLDDQFELLKKMPGQYQLQTDIITELLKSLGSIVAKNKLTDFTTFGSNVIEQVAGGMMDGRRLLDVSLTKVLHRVWGYFPHSMPLWGPLVTIMRWGWNIVGMIASGITGAVGVLAGAVTWVLSSTMSIAASIVERGARVVSDALVYGLTTALRLSEEFRLINYRLYGSMNQLHKEARVTAVQFNLLAREAVEAMTALMRTRIASDDLADMTGVVGQLTRATGISAQTLAEFDRLLRYGNNDLGARLRAMRDLGNQMRSFKLTAEEATGAINIDSRAAAIFDRVFGADATAQLAKLNVAMAGLGAQAGLLPEQMQKISKFSQKMFMDPVLAGQAEKLMGRQIKNVDDLGEANMVLGKRFKEMLDSQRSGGMTEAQAMMATAKAMGVQEDEMMALIKMYEKLNAVGLTPADMQDRAKVAKEIARAQMGSGSAEFAEFERQQEVSEHYREATASIYRQLGVMADKLQSTMARIGIGLEAALLPTVQWFAEKMPFIQHFVFRFMDGIALGLPKAITGISDAFKIFTEQYDLARSSGRNFLQAFGDGITAGWPILWDTVKKAFWAVRQLLPFSDAKEGPFSDLTKSGESVVTTISNGIKSAASYLYTTVSDWLRDLDIGTKVMDFIHGPFMGAVDTLTTDLNAWFPGLDIGSKLKEFIADPMKVGMEWATDALVRGIDHMADIAIKALEKMAKKLAQKAKDAVWDMIPDLGVGSAAESAWGAMFNQSEADFNEANKRAVENTKKMREAGSTDLAQAEYEDQLNSGNFWRDEDSNLAQNQDVMIGLEESVIAYTTATADLLQATEQQIADLNTTIASYDASEPTIQTMQPVEPETIKPVQTITHREYTKPVGHNLDDIYNVLVDTHRVHSDSRKDEQQEQTKSTLYELADFTDDQGLTRW